MWCQCTFKQGAASGEQGVRIRVLSLPAGFPLGGSLLLAMKIVVNHLTRMQQGYMCVAGIDMDTGLHVRPVLDHQMTIDMLSLHGGPFDIGRIVDLGDTRFVGRVPEVEDRWFDAAMVRHTDDMPSDQFWDLLRRAVHEKLGTIFGPDLERVGSTCAVAETAGLRSLGCYWANNGRLFLDDSRDRRRLRFAWNAGGYSFNVPVTDIRLYADDHVTPCEPRIHHLAERLSVESRVLVSVGLSRPYRKSANDPPRHWLQINNFHLADNPCWTLQSC